MSLPSQNATFIGAEPEVDSNPHVEPGESIAVTLRSELAERGWTVSEVELGIGWTVPCHRDERALDVVVVDDGGGWFLQIAPRQPSRWRWWRKGPPTATDDDMFELAVAVHAALVAAGFATIAWSWRGHPSDDGGAPEPTRPST